MPRKLSKSSIKPPVLITSPIKTASSAAAAAAAPHLSKTAEQRNQETEEMLQTIRETPIYDRYGRAHYNGTPIGSGDKQWRKQHGIGAKYSRQCSMLGIGITRDSFLPSECRINEQSALRETPRSSKITNETLNWAKKYNFHTDKKFMKQLSMVQKRVLQAEDLPIELSLQQREELFHCIYKISNYALLDKRQPCPPMGTSTREQMSKAQNWQGDTAASASDVFYFPTFKSVDKCEPRTVFGPNNQMEWIEKQRILEEKSKEQAEAREPHWSENTEMPQTMGTPNFDARIPTAPAFSFGVSERPPLSTKDPKMNPPIYNVHIQNDPQFLPRYKTFGAGYRSMGYAEKDRTKTLRPKSQVWGAPMPEINHEKIKSPVRFGLIISPKVPYGKYKLFG